MRHLDPFPCAANREDSACSMDGRERAGSRMDGRPTAPSGSIEGVRVVGYQNPAP